MLELHWIFHLQEAIRNFLSPVILFVSISLLLFYFMNSLTPFLFKQIKTQTFFDLVLSPQYPFVLQTW